MILTTILDSICKNNNEQNCNDSCNCKWIKKCFYNPETDECKENIIQLGIEDNINNYDAENNYKARNKKIIIKWKDDNIILTEEELNNYGKRNIANR